MVVAVGTLVQEMRLLTKTPDGPITQPVSLVNLGPMTGEINKWLKQYCRQGTLDDKLAAKYPLKEIQVSAEPVPGKPGMFKSEIQMISCVGS